MVDLLVLITGVLGAILVGQKKSVGFLWFIASSILTIILAIEAGYIGLGLTSLIFICIDIYYYRQWRKQDD